MGGQIVADVFSADLRRRTWHFGDDCVITMLLLSGAAEIECSGEDVARHLPAPALLWLPRRTSASVGVSPGAKGVILRIPPQRIDRSLIPGVISGQVRSATRRLQFHGALGDAATRSLEAGFETIATESARHLVGSDEIVNGHIGLILVTNWRMLREQNVELEEVSPVDLARRFLAEVGARFHDRMTIPDIAATLGVTPSRLTRAVRRAFGRSPQQVVHARILDEAERLLLETTLHVDEIAEMLGFSQPGYFNRFFKQHTGLPPGQFRRRKQGTIKRASARDFAAWP